MRAHWILLSAVLTLSACATMAQEEMPAVLVETNADARAEIVRVVGEALGNSDVLIANDALTRESTLFIERKPARDASGQRLSGRDYGKPERFDLVKQGDACVLVHASTQKRYGLKEVRCEGLGR
jgi:hypothetical protein